MQLSRWDPSCICSIAARDRRSAHELAQKVRDRVVETDPSLDVALDVVYDGQDSHRSHGDPCLLENLAGDGGLRRFALLRPLLGERLR